MTEKYPFPWRFQAARYGDLYLLKQISEAEVQKDILDLLSLYDVDAVPIDAGGRRQRGRMMGAAKAAGVDLASIQNVQTGGAIPAGFADLEATLAPTGCSLYIEVKAPEWRGADNTILRRAGQPSEEQLAFLLSKHVRGAAVLVAWSSKDVEHYLLSALKLNKRALARAEEHR